MRGDVYRLRDNHAARGHEQRGTRYTVVVQPDVLALSTMLVAPTSTSAVSSSFRPTIKLDGTRSTVLVEPPAAVDAESKLGAFAGRLDAAKIADVNQALLRVFELF